MLQSLNLNRIEGIARETVPSSLGTLSMQKRQVADRLFMFALLALVVLMSFYEPQSIQYQLSRGAGWPAYLSLFVLSILSLLALADTVVNDMLPDKYHLHISLKCRQLIWMFLAATLSGYAYVVFKNHAGAWIGLWYAICSIRCVSIAFLDLGYEFKGAKHA